MIREYTTKDKEETLELLRLNTPEFFSESEEADFINYLENKREDYFVVEEEGKIIGAGGINYFFKEKIARISWDVISPNFQGKGIGRKLSEHRIKYINGKPEIDVIVVRTSQLVYRFYEKMGFKLARIEKDFWAKNYDLYQMEMENKKELK